MQNRVSSFVIGMALFAMFFGSGNLIFPLFLGQIVQGEWPYASLGFILTAVILPLAGIFAMVVYKGDYSEFFDAMGKKLGFFIVIVLLFVWIPLGAGPRCIALAHACLLPYQEDPLSIWTFSAIYSVLVLAVAYNKGRILNLLGYILTPFLLFCLILIILKGVNSDALGSIAPSGNSFRFFQHGMSMGYHTMDLISSFFFSASIINMLRRSSAESEILSKTIKGSFVAAGLLAGIYVGLICLATSYEESLHHIPKEQLLVYIAKGVLGAGLGIIASLAFILACFTTSVALAPVFADFIANKFFKNPKLYPVGLIITQVSVFVMSITGLQGIMFITTPILTVFYPLLIGLIIFNLGKKYLSLETKEIHCAAAKD